ncbi:RNA polymerase sigma-54 factor [Plastorhodobacter daqingensis]|uniref:RNA polymerase sigma-54 factor n=1 Tax=Plastorhodobacter daqingensis TaxID=1387281 RepID=A0ABW2UFE9_9RHOB
MKPGLRIVQTQRLVLAPGIRQALALLRLPAGDLHEIIAREAAENPFLVVDEPVRPRGPRTSAYDVALDTRAATHSVLAQVFDQIGAMKLDPALRALALHLVADLREDGYLDTPLAELAAELGQPLATLEAALAVLHACEPAGIGARNLAECLELQLHDQGLERDLARRVVAQIGLFARPDAAQLRRAFDLPDQRIDAITRMVRRLRARPIEPEPAAAQPLVPDLVVTVAADGQFEMTPGRGSLQGVRVNAALRASARESGFGTEALARAEALVQALDYRQNTLRRIVTCLLRHQERALREGDEHMLPLTRGQIAAELGLHPSTVGRAVTGKAIEVAGRLWPLARFFGPALSAPGESEVSAFAVQRSIARLIAAEPPLDPLSDAEIQRRLLAEGVDISRRTVAKYRGCLRIPASHLRRRKRAQRVPNGTGPGGGKALT